MSAKIKYFIDTEFIERPGLLVPISIGMVCEDGRELHLVSNAFDPTLADAWVKKNVLMKLPPESTWKNLDDISREIAKFVNEPILAADKDAKLRPQFWAYFASYDWVCFCWLMKGRMVDLPIGWPKFCMDLKQSMAERNMVESYLPEKNRKLQHDALEDARWLRRAHAAVFG